MNKEFFFLEIAKNQISNKWCKENKIDRNTFHLHKIWVYFRQCTVHIVYEFMHIINVYSVHVYMCRVPWANTFKYFV